MTTFSVHTLVLLHMWVVPNPINRPEARRAEYDFRNVHNSLQAHSVRRRLKWRMNTSFPICSTWSRIGRDTEYVNSS
jgi:hypothetical protein